MEPRKKLKLEALMKKKVPRIWKGGGWWGLYSKVSAPLKIRL